MINKLEKLIQEVDKKTLTISNITNEEAINNMTIVALSSIEAQEFGRDDLVAFFRKIEDLLSEKWDKSFFLCLV